MTDPFKAAKLARKRRTKWWREHIALAYIVVTSSFALVFFSVRLVDRKLPGCLTALGVTPSGVDLIIGTAWCGLGLWGIRAKGNGVGLIVVYGLCLLGGLLTLAKAFQLF
jgi:hypothetical protein